MKKTVLILIVLFFISCEKRNEIVLPDMAKEVGMAKLPDSGISISMVAQTLGVGSSDLGTLCTHPNVNKWSNRQPTVNLAHPSSWIPIQQSTVTLATYYLSYHKLSGISAQYPARLGDFRGYNHAAQPHAFTPVYPTIEIHQQATEAIFKVKYHFGDIDLRDYSCTYLYIRMPDNSQFSYRDSMTLGDWITVPSIQIPIGVNNDVEYYIKVPVLAGEEKNVTMVASFGNASIKSLYIFNQEISTATVLIKRAAPVSISYDTGNTTVTYNSNTIVPKTTKIYISGNQDIVSMYFFFSSADVAQNFYNRLNENPYSNYLTMLLRNNTTKKNNSLSYNPVLEPLRVGVMFGYTGEMLLPLDVRPNTYTTNVNILGTY